MRSLHSLSLWSVLMGVLAALLLAGALERNDAQALGDALATLPQVHGSALLGPPGDPPAAEASLGLATVPSMLGAVAGLPEAKGGSTGGGGSGSRRGGYSSSSSRRNYGSGGRSGSYYDDDTGRGSSYGRGGCVGCFGFGGGLLGPILMIGIVVIIASVASRIFR